MSQTFDGEARAGIEAREDMEHELIEAIAEEAAALREDARRLLHRRRQLLAHRQVLIEKGKALVREGADAKDW
jgi:hypothetical protein